MLKTLRNVGFAAVVTVLGGAAEASQWFPMHRHDAWSLEGPFGATTMKIDTVDSAGWHHFTGLLGADVWVYASGERIYVWNEQTNKSFKLLDFAAATGATWNSRLGEQTVNVAVLRRNAGLHTALGAQQGCVEFAFGYPGLYDAGVVRQAYCPGLGLVEQESMSIAGPRLEHTVMASIAGELHHGRRGSGFEVTLDRAAALSGQKIRVTMTIWDSTGVGREFQTPTPQAFELRLLDAEGQELARWSDGRMFPMVLGHWTLEGEATFQAELLLQNRDGSPLAPGAYTLEATLLDLNAPRPTALAQLSVN